MLRPSLRAGVCPAALLGLWVALFVVLCIVLRAVDVRAQAVGRPVVAGLDHVPVAVGDLDAAAARYAALGFTLKPGRPHANGIENRHVKFADGTEVELITAPAARDALTGRYRRHLAEGDGPAFLALFTPNVPAAADTLARLGQPHTGGSRLLTIPDGDALSYVFFGPRNASPTDRPAHFAHANTAETLLGVWLAGDDLTAERRLLEGLGAVVREEVVYVPWRERAPVARLPEGFVVFLPGRHQLVAGRPIVGMTVAVRSVAAARRAVADSGVAVPPVLPTPGGASVFLPPALTHGFWLELREVGRWEGKNGK